MALVIAELGLHGFGIDPRLAGLLLQKDVALLDQARDHLLRQKEVADIAEQAVLDDLRALGRGQRAVVDARGAAEAGHAPCTSPRTG